MVFWYHVKDMKETKKILGIDPGFGRLGFGCVEDKNGIYFPVDFGVITTEKNLEFSKRLVQIHDDLDLLVKELRPDIVAVEKLFFAKNSKTAMNVAEARGVTLFVLEKNNLPIYEFTPAQIKMAVTGDGKADKRAVQEMVKLLLKLQRIPKIDDAADALAVAITAAGARLN